MYLLIYSIDTDYFWEDGVDEPYFGEKEFLFANDYQEMVNELYKVIQNYGGEDDVLDILNNEKHYLEDKEYYVDTHYLTIHGCFVVQDTLDFKLKDTQEFKDFVKLESFRLEVQKKAQEEYRKEQEEERERAELKRLKEKYE